MNNERPLNFAAILITLIVLGIVSWVLFMLTYPVLVSITAVILMVGVAADTLRTERTIRKAK